MKFSSLLKQFFQNFGATGHYHIQILINVALRLVESNILFLALEEKEFVKIDLLWIGYLTIFVIYTEMKGKFKAISLSNLTFSINFLYF